MTNEEQVFVNAIAMQRNQALDAVATLQSEIAKRDAVIAQLNAEILALGPQPTMQ